MTTAVPRIIPYLYYSDLGRAVGWLIQAFGWREKMRANGADGKPFHAELIVGTDGVLMMGCPGPKYRNPKDLGHVTQSLYVRVDDVDALFARATSAGAKVIEPPADQEYGDRRCAVETVKATNGSLHNPSTRSNCHREKPQLKGVVSHARE